VIHPTAVVDPRAELAADVIVEEFCSIKGRVTLGPGAVVHAHSVLRGTTRIGARCRIGPGAYVGTDPQHRDYRGEETRLVVGDDTIIREGATLHRSVHAGDDHATIVGSRCFIMAWAHVAHDCRVGDGVTMANNVLLGGHVEVGDGAFLGGGCVIHQFCRIGRLAIVGGGEIITRDVLPFAALRNGGLKAYNAVGCRRSEMGRKSIAAVRGAFQRIHSCRSVQDAVEQIVTDDEETTPEIRDLAEFVRTSRRGVLPSARFLASFRATADAEH
jgi:UDP-N-acetylglucosamine acyltransferase